MYFIGSLLHSLPGCNVYPLDTHQGFRSCFLILPDASGAKLCEWIVCLIPGIIKHLFSQICKRDWAKIGYCYYQTPIRSRHHIWYQLGWFCRTGSSWTISIIFHCGSAVRYVIKLKEMILNINSCVLRSYGQFLNGQSTQSLGCLCSTFCFLIMKWMKSTIILVEMHFTVFDGDPW